MALPGGKCSVIQERRWLALSREISSPPSPPPSAMKGESDPFPSPCLGSQVPWKLPQIFTSDKHWRSEASFCAVCAPEPQRQMTRCHSGATRIYTPVARTSNKQSTRAGEAGEGPALSSGTLSSAHLPVKTRERRGAFKKLTHAHTPGVHIHTPPYASPLPSLCSV